MNKAGKPRDRETGRIKKYLGLPNMISRSKIYSFQSLKDRTLKRVQEWKEKRLSKGGKGILIKVVAQSIPT